MSDVKTLLKKTFFMIAGKLRNSLVCNSNDRLTANFNS